MKITLAIPSYNGLSYLKRLIPRVLEEDFDDVFVLDDASKDGSAEFLRKNFPSVKVIRGRKNVGPTANRNRMLKQSFGDILVFLDVDMELVSKKVTPKIKKLFQKYPKAAVFGGFILGETGEPMWYNRGYDLHPIRSAKSAVLHQMALNFWDDPAIRGYIKENAKEVSLDFEKPKDGKVDWVTEAFFMVRGGVFKKLGGFDEGFKMFHEGPDFCKQARTAGFDVRFTTKLKAKHLGAKSTPEAKRKKYFLDSTIYWYKKHYGIPRDLVKKFIS
ncbi:glycosyltransferase [Candidatus Saccharibacteria bacterium]|nr:glycosyltransferase [Candidatus Saccharibacteria bacterium]